MAHTNKIVKDNFPIQPHNIDTDEVFLGFGGTESSYAAYLIVDYCQKLGKWGPFSREEINRFFNEKRQQDYENEIREGTWDEDLEKPVESEFNFYYLIKPELVRHPFRKPILRGGGLIIEKEGMYYITEDFIRKCFETAPKNF